MTIYGNKSAKQRINESTKQRIEACSDFGWRGWGSSIRLFVYSFLNRSIYEDTPADQRLGSGEQDF